MTRLLHGFFSVCVLVAGMLAMADEPKVDWLTDANATIKSIKDDLSTVHRG